MGNLGAMTCLTPVSSSSHFFAHMPGIAKAHYCIKNPVAVTKLPTVPFLLLSNPGSTTGCFNFVTSTSRDSSSSRQIAKVSCFAAQKDSPSPTIEEEQEAQEQGECGFTESQGNGSSVTVKILGPDGNGVAELEMERTRSESNGEGFRPKRIAFDYGFQAKFISTGPYVPRNVFRLAFENFGREWRALRRFVLFGELKRIDPAQLSGPIKFVTAYTGRGFRLLLRGLDKFLTLYDGLTELQPLSTKGENTEQDDLREALKNLKLSNEAVSARENSRPPVEAPWWIRAPYILLCAMLDIIFKDRPIQRFWFLETVARMPYFSYISMLHLYETLGWWRAGAEVRRVHFAEEWNEMHHLKIMESLGGDLEWADRFFGQHAAFFYYWILNLMFLISPKVAYNFSELIEMHAVDTYGEFVDENEELLKKLPPSPVAVRYYENEDLYLYDEFQTSQMPETRRPKIDSLYDVFVAICGDEGEHVKTMVACQQLDIPVRSPHDRKKKA